MIDHLPSLPILLPLIAGFVLLFLRGASMRLQRALSLAATLALLPLAASLVAATADGSQFVYLFGNWAAPFGIVLVVDRLAALLLLVTAVVASFALWVACRGTDTAGRHFHVLWALQLFGLNGAFLTGDLFNLFVFFEILLLASYGLLLHGGGRLRVRAGLHFVVINLVGSTLFLFAVATLYGVTGTLNMADLALRLAETTQENQALVETAGLLLFGVFALKAALVPLYLWLPAAYSHTSAPVAALFAIMTKVGAYAILRVYTLMFGESSGAVAGLLDAWLLPLALATLALGTLGAIAATRLRQQVAYLVIASIGTLLTGAALGNADGLAAALYYLPHTTLATAGMFLLADLIARGRGEFDDRFEPGPELAGAAWIGGLFFVFAMAMVGLPPLAGFFAKFLLLQAALDSAHSAWVWAVVLVTSLLGMVALARSGSLLFFRSTPTATLAGADRREAPPGADRYDAAPRLAPNWRDALPLAGLVMTLAALVVAAAPLVDYATAAANALYAPAGYIDAVLSTWPIGEVEPLSSGREAAR